MKSSLYFHIPFCLRKCNYCDFNSFAEPELSTDYYVKLLLEELRLRAVSVQAQVVPTIYFGGGTPSLLTPAEISSLLEEVRHHFQLDTAVEITLEANPGTVTPESLQGYLSAGITRLSLGVQSLDDRQLALLGRIHTAETARGAYAAARTAGFDNVGIDLIHGLPGQTIEDWVKTLQAAVGMKPEHISAYGLSVEEGTPLAVLADRGELDLPDEDTAAAMFEITSEFLRKSGYEHYEISNFALPGYRSRHNQVYWQRGNYLGFGAGAHSFLNTPGHGGRWENPAALPEYAAIVNSAELPELQSSMTHGEAMSEFMFLGLRLLEGVDRGDFARQYGKELEEAFPKIVSLLGEKGLLCLEGTNVRLTSRGLLLANQVMQEFV